MSEGQKGDDEISIKSFDDLREKYTAWEERFLKSLGPPGKWMLRRIDARSKWPDWKKVQRLWIWIAITAFVVGLLVAGKYYEYQCNKHIVEEFYPEAACRIGEQHPKLNMKCVLDPEEYRNYDMSPWMNASRFKGGGDSND